MQDHGTTPESPSPLRQADLIDPAVKEHDYRPLFLAVGLTLVAIVAVTLPRQNFFASPADYVPIHTILEFVAISVSTMVFGLGWNLRQQRANNRSIVLASSFLAVALFDLFHTLSYQGMPPFITPSDPEKAIAFWLAGRFAAAMGLLSVAVLSERRWSPSACNGVLAAAMLATVSASILGFLHLDWLPRTFIPGQGLTAAKIGTEYALMALYGVATLLLLRQNRDGRPVSQLWLAAACWTLCVGESFFTLYDNVTDLFNLLGHVYKALAYVMIYRALFVEGVQAPYRALARERAHLRVLLTSIPDLVWLKDRNGVFLSCNQEFERFFGAPEADIVGRTDYDFVDRDQADFFRRKDVEAMAKGKPSVNEESVTYTSDGHEACLETIKTPMFDEVGRLIGVLGVARDITARKKAEERITRLSNLYAVLSQCNQAIVHCGSEAELFPQICRCVVEYGFAKMAWIGLVDGEGKRLTPVASYGDGMGYLDGIEIAVDAIDPLARGPCGTAIRDDMPIWCQDFLQDPTTAPWHERARSAGLRGLATLPLHRNGIPIGCLAIYAAETNAFDRDVQKLLLEMMTDITFALDNFAREANRKEAAEKINELAFFDQLTGLPNRTLLIDRLKQSMAASSRNNTYGALLLIDLDNFKTLNDTLGHDMGDLLLKRVGQRLTTSIRSGDTVARFGGDEFVLVLQGLDMVETDAASQVETVAGKILSALNQPYQLDDVSYRCTPSIGVTLFKGQMASDDLLKQADLAMYRSKAAGRNAIRFFDPAMEAAVVERATLEADLREALQRRQFLLNYQPQVVHSDRVIGAEVLLRWQHASRGMIFPAKFIPLAEETGLILPLGEWVLETACIQLAEWAKRPEMAHLTIAVNVSALQFHQHDFVARVLAILKRTGADPQRLKLELTESLLVANVEDIIEKMVALKASGVSFSLDDFGTGYSSLSYLKRLPLEQLKIDRSFVRDLLDDPDDAAIAKTIVALAESLRIDVIAEGVETAEQRDLLENLGCHVYQGYLFSRPLPLAAFERFAQAKPAPWLTEADSVI